MNGIISLVILLIFMQFSCAEMVDKNRIAIKNIDAGTNSTPEEIIEKHRIKLEPVDKIIIYSQVLSVIINDDSNSKTLGLIEPTEWLVYRSETISPFKIEQIDNNNNIPKSLLGNFIEENQKTESLEDEYSVLAPTQIFTGNSDLAKFYSEAKRKYPKTKVAVSLSNIGIDDDYSKALIYVEYFHADKKLMKFYLELTIIKRNTTIYVGKIDSFSGYKIYPIS